MIQSLLNSNVTIKRRVDTSVASRDALGNPVYGNPITDWSTVYTNMPVRLAFTSREMTFVSTGERVTPNGIMYYPTDYILQINDRVETSDGIQYVVGSITIGYLFGSVVSHYEAVLSLP